MSCTIEKILQHCHNISQHTKSIPFTNANVPRILSLQFERKHRGAMFFHRNMPWLGKDFATPTHGWVNLGRAENGWKGHWNDPGEGGKPNNKPSPVTSHLGGRFRSPCYWKCFVVGYTSLTCWSQAGSWATRAYRSSSHIMPMWTLLKTSNGKGSSRMLSRRNQLVMLRNSPIKILRYSGEVETGKGSSRTECNYPCTHGFEQSLLNISRFAFPESHRQMKTYYILLWLLL